MSIFRPTSLDCPACQAKVEFRAVHSVNADRRPDLRAGILDETFQQEQCPKCGNAFRLDPEFNLMDTQRGQWIAAAPLRNLPRWEAEEKHARELFEHAYGPTSGAFAQEIGKNLVPRVTFGWPALREKILVSEYLLDDVVVEMCKAFVMRNSDSRMSAETELRLIDVVDGDLVMGWLITSDESRGPTMRVARTVYDQIAADEDGDWEELKATFAGALFVDLNRMLMVSPPVGAPAGAEVPAAEAPKAPAAEVAEDPAASGIQLPPAELPVAEVLEEEGEEVEEEPEEGTGEGEDEPGKGQ